MKGWLLLRGVGNSLNILVSSFFIIQFIHLTIQLYILDMSFVLVSIYGNDKYYITASKS